MRHRELYVIVPSTLFFVTFCDNITSIAQSLTAAKSSCKQKDNHLYPFRNPRASFSLQYMFLVLFSFPLFPLYLFHLPLFFFDCSIRYGKVSRSVHQSNSVGAYGNSSLSLISSDVLLRLQFSVIITMFPSKTDRILSRYRPIAPKPAPLQPTASLAATDPSSNDSCSFASSRKRKRSRRRRSDFGTIGVNVNSSVKAPKLVYDPSSFHAFAPPPPHPVACQISSNISNTAASSSGLTQGTSDGSVPFQEYPAIAAVYSSKAEDANLKVSNRRVSRDAIDNRLPNPNIRPWPPAAASYGAPGVHPLRTAPIYLAIPAAPAAGAPAYVEHGVLLQPNLGLQAPIQQRNTFPTISSQLQADPSQTLVSSKAPYFDSAGVTESVANSTAVQLPERSVSSSHPMSLPTGSVQQIKGSNYGAGAGGFTEMIRGITRLRTAADVQSLMQVRTNVVTSTAGSTTSGAGPSPSGENTSVSVPVYSFQHYREAAHPGAFFNDSASTSSSTISSINMELEQRKLPSPSGLISWDAKCAVPKSCESGRKSPVTLPLLPDVPSKLDSNSTILQEAHSQGDLSSLCSTYSAKAGLETSTSTSMYGGAPSTSSDRIRTRLQPNTIADAGAESSSVQPQTQGLVGVDQLYLEQVYGSSIDPVVLVDDNQKVIWFNKAYDKALKAATERTNSGKGPPGSYIDPLGHPTPLGSFDMGSSGTGSNATLWGFLKKLVIQDQLDPEDSGNLGLRLGETMTESCCATVSASTYAAEAAAAACVRQVTTVTLESVWEVAADVMMTESLEAVEARLAIGVEPAFVTDVCTGRVRWVNAAFKQMVGGGDGDMGTYVCCAEKIPGAASAFSGRVNVEWSSKGGKRRSMTVPCDVCRLLSGSGNAHYSWVWKFDVAVSLSLN